MGTSEVVQPVAERVEAERREYEWLLTSGVLGRSGNLARVLRYICEEHFQGRAEQIKEYTIAVEALGRRSVFDPQTDTIVRVTVHSLRKRLMEIYQNEGADHPVRLVLPPGHYAPSFVHQSPVERIAAKGLEQQTTFSAEGKTSEVSAGVIATPGNMRGHSVRFYLAWSIGALLLVAASLATWFLTRDWKKEHLARQSVPASLPAPVPQATIRALMGTDRAAYVDHSGNTWSTASYCQGGTNINIPPQRVEGTEDAPLYSFCRDVRSAQCDAFGFDFHQRGTSLQRGCSR
jgi:hypothetical protein